MLRELLARVGRVVGDYLLEVLWAEYAQARVELQTLPARLRFLFWLGIGLIAANVVLTVAFYFGGERLAQVEFAWNTPQRVPLAALWVAAPGFAVGWAFVLTGAAASNPLIFLFVVLVFTFSVPIVAPGWGGPVGPGFWPLLPGVACLVLTPWTLRRQPMVGTRGVALQGLVAYLVAGIVLFIAVFVTPARQLAPPETRWTLVALLALPLAGLLLWLRRWTDRAGAFGYWLLAAAPIGAFAAWSAWLGVVDLGQTAYYWTLSFLTLAGYVGIFWFALGAWAVSSADALGQWLVRSLRTLFPVRWLPVLVFAVWLAIVVAGQLPVFQPLRVSTDPSALGFRDALLLACTFASWVVLGFAAAAGLLWLVGRLSVDGLLVFFRLSLLALLLALGGFLAAFELISGQAGRLGLWALLVYLAGLLGESFKNTAPFVNDGSRWFPREGRLLLWLGFLLVMMAVSHFTLNASLDDVNRLIQLQTLYGAIFLSLPGVLYTVVADWRPGRLPSPRLLVMMFAVGALSAWGAAVLGGAVAAPAEALVGLILLLPFQIVAQELVRAAVLTLALRRLGADDGRRPAVVGRPSSVVGRLSSTALHWSAPLVLAAVVGLGIATVQAHPVELLPRVPLLVPLHDAQFSPGTVGVIPPGLSIFAFGELARLYLENIAAGALAVVALVILRRSDRWGRVARWGWLVAAVPALAFRGTYEAWLAATHGLGATGEPSLAELAVAAAVLALAIAVLAVASRGRAILPVERSPA